MGITIYFSGKIDNPSKSEDLIDELTAIATELKWKYDCYEFEKEDNKPHVKGITMHPHEKSESMAIAFTPEGRLISPVSLHLGFKEEEFIYTEAIKTQFAPLEIHIAVIKLLKYLKSKYISNLRVIDEGDYWNTMDVNILKEKMDFLASKINLLGDILDAQSENLGKAKTPEELADEIEKILGKLGFSSEDSETKET